MTPLPEWMLHREENSPEIYSNRNSGALRIVRKSVRSFNRLITKAVSDESAALSSGLLQKIDARAKVPALIALLVVAAFQHSIAALAVCYLFCIILAVFSRISFRRFAGVWFVVPLFTVGIMLPSVFNIITKGNPVWIITRFSTPHLGPWHLPEYLAVTDTGLIIAGRMVLRTAACVSIVVLLTATTRLSSLFKGLRSLGVPKVFVVLLGMMVRYLGIVAGAAEEMHLAKLSRTIGCADAKQERNWAAAGIGALFRRSYALSMSIHMAMLSRGYTGEIKLLDEPHVGLRDMMFVVSMAAVCLCVIKIGMWN